MKTMAFVEYYGEVKSTGYSGIFLGFKQVNFTIAISRLMKEHRWGRFDVFIDKDKGAVMFKKNNGKGRYQFKWSYPFSAWLVKQGGMPQGRYHLEDIEGAKKGEMVFEQKK